MRGEDELGFKLLRADKDVVELERVTTETIVKCRVESGPRRECRIDTGLNFVNHMVEMLAYYSELNIDLEVEARRYKLVHTLVEDAGITLGRAFHMLSMERVKEYGIKGFGFSKCVLDESCSEAQISFEGRVGCWIHENSGIRRFTSVEDIQEEFIKSFFEGFSQGMRATIHVELVRGSDPHHLWEAAFRAFGESLRQALSRDEWRRGFIAGVKKTVE